MSYRDEKDAKIAQLEGMVGDRDARIADLVNRCRDEDDRTPPQRAFDWTLRASQAWLATHAVVLYAGAWWAATTTEAEWPTGVLVFAHGASVVGGFIYIAARKGWLP
jgi:hypothetical protein